MRPFDPEVQRIDCLRVLPVTRVPAMKSHTKTSSWFLVLTTVLMVTKSAKSGFVRLVNGKTPYEGQVELFVEAKGGWLPVLYYTPWSADSREWSFQAANVVCKELGFNSAMRHRMEFGALDGDSRLRVTNVRCGENVTSLAECNFDFYESYKAAAVVTCNYDAYLGCYTGMLTRDTDFTYLSHMTIQSCLDYCRRHRSTYAGLQSRRYCICGDEDMYQSLTQAPLSACMAPCSGDNSQICGGSDNAGVYLASMGSCGGHTTGSGTIYSPGFPGNERGTQTCTWHIDVRPGNAVAFEFVFSGLDADSETLTVSENYNEERRTIEFENATALSCTNSVDVTFQSQAKGVGMFALKFREIRVCPSLHDSNYSDIVYHGTPCPHVPGSIVSVRCKPGYVLAKAEDSVGCQEDGEWNATLPQCVVSEIGCGDPGYVANADRIDSYIYNRTIRYKCHSGYSSSGDDVIRCTKEGRWTTKPVCRRNHTKVLTETASTSTEEGYIAAAIVVGVLTFVVLVVAGVMCIFRRNIGNFFRKDDCSRSTDAQRKNTVNEDRDRNDISIVLQVNPRLLGEGSGSHAYEYSVAYNNSRTRDAHGAESYHESATMRCHSDEDEYSYIDNTANTYDDVARVAQKSDGTYRPYYRTLDYNELKPVKRGQFGNLNTHGQGKVEYSGTVDNVAYESAGLGDDGGDVYSEIDDRSADYAMVDDVADNSTNNSADNVDADVESVDNVRHESTENPKSDDGPEYAVLEGP
ncbi:uncharacterized protein [Ptychodera flava]|uniref:uncharacterized protein isoform X2 n=1 Tax=Ptychodera flava TaxID=63121 RepID=UPI003969E33C